MMVAGADRGSGGSDGHAVRRFPSASALPTISFRTAESAGGSGIDEVDAVLDGRTYRGNRFRFVGPAPRIGAFLQGLQQVGWTIGGNVQIDQRWLAVGDAEMSRKYAAELVALAPDVILTTGGVAVRPLLQATRTVPIVFVNTPDPVGAFRERNKIFLFLVVFCPCC
jgi:hypothetical protein